MNLLTQSVGGAQTPQAMIYLMYGGLIAFFVFKIFKGFQARKLAKGQTVAFGKNFSKTMLLLGVLVLGFGFFNIYAKEYISGALMIGLVIVLYIEYTTKNIFAENGFVADGKFVEWNEVKKWAFNSENGELVVKHKKGYEEKTSYLRVNPSQINEVDNLFRKYKLKK